MRILPLPYYPLIRCTDPRFVYTPSEKTDIRKRFDDVQKSQAAKGRDQSPVCEVRDVWDAGRALQLLTIWGKGDGDKSL